MNTLMIYGAAGYTGGLAAEHAASAGLNLVLAGREKDRARLEALAGRLGATVSIISLDDPDAVARVRNAGKISIALHVAGAMSRGSATSANQNIAPETLHLVDGELVTRSPEQVRDFDFGGGPQSSSPVTLPDLVTIHQATGVPHIETFVHVTAGAFPTEDLKDLPAGPSVEEREASRYHAAVEVTDADGTVVRSVLDTVNGYTFTSLAAAEAARRVLDGEVRPGFQTPAGLFGNGFAETIADTRIIDL